MSTQPLKRTQMVLHVTIKIDPSKTQPYLEALRPAYECVVHEPECVFFDMFHSDDEPGLFRFVEGWTKDKEWFMKHQLTKPYYHPYEEATKPMWTEPPKFLFTNRIDGWSTVSKEYLESSQQI